MRHSLEEMSERFEIVKCFLEEESEAGAISDEIADKVACVVGVEFTYHTYAEMLRLLGKADDLVVRLISQTGLEESVLFGDYLNAKSKL
jgi:hypothetical protein